MLTATDKPQRHVTRPLHAHKNTHLHGRLAAEVAEVLGVLGHLDLLDALAKHGTIARAELASDAHLLGSLGLWVWGRVSHRCSWWMCR